MPISEETMAAFKKLAAATAVLDQRIKKVDAEVGKRTTKIAEAIAANDTTLLDIQLAAIGGDIDEVSTLLHDANGSLNDLDKLQRDGGWPYDEVQEGTLPPSVESLPGCAPALRGTSRR